MRPFTSTMPFAEALALALEAARPIERVDTVSLAGADGRVLAADVQASADVPPFSRSAMDGYAVRAADTVGASEEAPRRLRLAGRVFTGEVWPSDVAADTCIEIATGAPLPSGADAVVMVERTRREGDEILVLAPASAGQHVGRQGADMRSGDVVLRAGDIVDPARAGAAAATGATTLRVYARPSVALVSTGNEVVEPGEMLGPGQIHDVNRFTLGAVVRRHGGVPVPLALAGDTLEELDRWLSAALVHDVVVASGGSSVGERDLLRDAVAARGRILFHGIAVKPGKPTLLAMLDDTPVFGMPGNPTSCLSNGYLLLAPFLRKMARLPSWEPRRVVRPLTRDIRSASDRHQFYTVRLADSGAEPAFKGSGEITSMAHADGYIEIEAGTDLLAAGTPVTVTLF